MRRRAAATASAVLIALTLSTSSIVLAAAPAPGNDQASTNEDTPVTIHVLANDTDPDGDPLQIVSIENPPFGRADVTPVLGYIQYTPDPDFNGQDRFQYTVADPGGTTATALVTVFVSAVNDRPTAWDRVYTVPEDGSVQVTLGGTDPDAERCDLSFVMEPQTPFGRFSPLTDGGCNPNGDMVNTVYTPLPGYNGPDSTSYVVFDGTVQSAFATVQITVTPVEDAPVALDGTATTQAGTPVTITIRGYDWETCELGFAIDAPASNGSLSAIGARPCGPGGPVDQHVDEAVITYTPAPGFSGPDNFAFTVTDAHATSPKALVSITVVPPASVHVGDLDASRTKLSGAWQATATVRVDAAGHAAQPGAIVRGTWGTGATSTCTTNANGVCSVPSGSIPRKVQSTTFRVTSVTLGSAAYQSSANHDPDGDSNGTLISISRP
jgi:hypothetical protein